jgi:hypothetical protein|tara:strand:+ start:6669 stop:7499 length:831 start_codon:yes stop_codon:yes gene_type:complete
MIPKNIKYEENNAFISFDSKNSGLVFDDSSHAKYPIRYYNVINGEGAEIKKDHSYYGFCYEGFTNFRNETDPPFNLMSGQAFSMQGPFELTPSTSKIMLIEVLHTKGIYPETNYKAMTVVCGGLEKEGRLKYIDGCTDSLLIPPVKMGDPCFNHLSFPKNIDQTQHTHPSHRIGIVAKGQGRCITPFGILPLVKGMIFVIKEWDKKTYNKGLDGKDYPNGQHSFETTDEGMDVVAFHPDSDFGATDINHPMINRTLVKNEKGELVSASEIESIRTK